MTCLDSPLPPGTQELSPPRQSGDTQRTELYVTHHKDQILLCFFVDLFLATARICDMGHSPPFLSRVSAQICWICPHSVSPISTSLMLQVPLAQLCLFRSAQFFHVSLLRYANLAMIFDSSRWSYLCFVRHVTPAVSFKPKVNEIIQAPKSPE